MDWLKTTDKMPEDGQLVFAVVKDNHFNGIDYDILRYCPRENYWDGDYGQGFSVDDARHKVLAWMPIPKYTD